MQYQNVLMYKRKLNSLHTQAVCLKLDKVKCEHNFSSFLFSHESLKRIVKWIREFRFDHAT